MIDLPSAVTNCFVGEYLQGYLINPVPSGYSMRSSKVPVSGAVLSGLGTPLVEGDLIMRMVSGSNRLLHIAMACGSMNQAARSLNR